VLPDSAYAGSKIHLFAGYLQRPCRRKCSLLRQCRDNPGPPKQAFISFPPYRNPSEERSASQKRTLAFYSATILAYFGNQAAYRAHLKKLCKSAAFFALFCQSGPLSREVLRRRTQCAGSCVPMPGSHPPKNCLLMTSTCQRPYEEEIGRPIGPI
jgi:hypothetical protein